MQSSTGPIGKIASTGSQNKKGTDLLYYQTHGSSRSLCDINIATRSAHKNQ